MSPKRGPERDFELDALLGAYALDALDDLERARVEAYLAAHPSAQAEVDDLRETAAALALAPVDDVEAPPELWERIEGEIADDELAVRRTQRRLWVMPVAAAIVLVLGVGVAVVLRDDDSAMVDVAGAYDAALDEGAREIALASAGSEVVSIALLPDGTGYLRNEGLEPLGADEVYQLWALVGAPDAEPIVISAGVLGSQPEYAALTVEGPVQGFVVTVEDAPGVPVSTKDPVAVSV